MNALYFALVPALSLAAWGGNSGDFSKAVIEPPPAQSRWSVGIGYSTLTNVDVEFAGIGGWRSPNPVPPSTPGIDRRYDDGFNRLDSTGNGGGKTWNWGYENPSQYDPSGNGAISMSIFRSIGTGISDTDSDDWHPGMELFGYYDMGQVTGLSNGARWGFKIGFNWHPVDFNDANPTRTRFKAVSDTFQLNGVKPPKAPYSGSYFGPGPLLGDSASQTSSSNVGSGSVTGARRFTSNLFGLDLGPYIDFPIGSRFSARFEGGLTLVIASADYSQSSTTSFPGIPSQSAYAHASDTSLLGGAFIGGTMLFELTDKFSLYSGVRYQWVNDFEIRAGGSVATLNMGGGLLLNIGGIYRF